MQFMWVLGTSLVHDVCHSNFELLCHHEMVKLISYVQIRSGIVDISRVNSLSELKASTGSLEEG